MIDTLLNLSINCCSCYLPSCSHLQGQGNYNELYQITGLCFRIFWSIIPNQKKKKKSSSFYELYSCSGINCKYVDAWNLLFYYYHIIFSLKTFRGIKIYFFWPNWPVLQQCMTWSYQRQQYKRDLTVKSRIIITGHCYQ